MTELIQRLRKRPDVKIISQSQDIYPQLAENRPKIDQNLWMVQKMFEIFFGLKGFDTAVTITSVVCSANRSAILSI